MVDTVYDSTREPPDYFWDRVLFGFGDDACWMWHISHDEDGYASLWNGAEKERVHRVSYAKYNGPIPVGLVVRHRCDNPPCVRPSHLELGTIADNNRDMVLRKRHEKATKMFCPKGHPYSGDNLYLRPTVDGRQFRECRTCIKDRRKRIAS